MDLLSEVATQDESASVIRAALAPQELSVFASTTFAVLDDDLLLIGVCGPLKLVQFPCLGLTISKLACKGRIRGV